MSFNMDGYVPVNDRLAAFYEAFPTGSIQSEIHTLTDKLVIVRATVYRTPDDPRPAIAHSQLAIPGSTSFTRGSEVENAETSAWGRAIAALGFEVKKGVASHEEVRNKRVETAPIEPGSPVMAPRPVRWSRSSLRETLSAAGMKVSDLQSVVGSLTSETYGTVLDEWFGNHPKETVESLVGLAQQEMEAPVA